MKNKLAVIIIGKQNSGKTTTIKYFDKIFDENEKLKKYYRVGWRRLTMFKGKLDALFLLIYFVPASPTETQKPLRDRLKNFKPELLLIAEQLNGYEYQNTIHFLEKNNYEIVEFVLKNQSNQTWNNWNKQNMNEILNKRAIDIGDKFKDFIRERIK